MNRESAAVDQLLTRRRSHPVGANFFGALAAAAITVLFCLLLLAHDPLVFWNDDYQISILPVFADVARAWSHRELPLLTPHSWVCGNLAGEFQYGTFSVFVNALVGFIWKLPLAFAQQAAALSIAHLAVLSAGAFLLAREYKLSACHSLFVAIVASLNGWIVCWGASDWFGALGAFSWLPWAWWGAQRALDASRSRWRFLWPAPFVYLLVTGGFPYTVVMLLVVLAWLAVRELAETRRLTTFVPLFLGVALGSGMAAPAWLALLEYVRGSARETLQASSHLQWVVPWSAWPGLIFAGWTVKWPDFSSKLVAHPAIELACGSVPIAAILAAGVAKPRAFVRTNGWELLPVLLIAVLAMMPTTGMFRWSFRWLPLFHLALALCAAEGLKLTAQGSGQRQPSASSKSSLVAAAHLPSSLALILAVTVVLVAKCFGFAGDHPFPLAWILIALATAWVALDFAAPLRKWSPVAIAFLALLATYLCLRTNCGVPKYNFAPSLLRPEPLDPQRLYIGFYPEPEHAYRLEAHPSPVGQVVRPGSTPMWAGLRFVNGYSPIRPAGVAREFATAIHGEIEPSVGQWLAWSEARPDGLLERLGIDGIIIARQLDFTPLPAGEWPLVFETEEARVYHRRGDPLARVRSVNWDDSKAVARIGRISDSRNCVTLDVDVPAGKQPALLAFSRPYFPGYRARLGRRELPVTTVRNLAPLVEVPAGSRGRLTLSYRPAWLVYGGALAALSALVWTGCAIFAGTERRRAMRPRT